MRILLHCGGRLQWRRAVLRLGVAPEGGQCKVLWGRRGEGGLGALREKLPGRCKKPEMS